MPANHGRELVSSTESRSRCILGAWGHHGHHGHHGNPQIRFFYKKGMRGITTQLNQQTVSRGRPREWPWWPWWPRAKSHTRCVLRGRGRRFFLNKDAGGASIAGGFGQIRAPGCTRSAFLRGSAQVTSTLFQDRRNPADGGKEPRMGGSCTVYDMSSHTARPGHNVAPHHSLC